jgi:hypothetical protein
LVNIAFQVSLWYNELEGISKNPFRGKAAMYGICFVKLPWSAAARLRKFSLQLPYISVFPLTKRVFRDVLDKILKRGV